MNFRQSAICAAAAALVVGTAGSAGAVTEIQWWHAHGGALGERVNEIADNFNRSQSDYKVVAVFKGSYAETMTAGVAAFRAGKAPHILQVFEVGTATMIGAKGAVVPIYKLMADAKVSFDPEAYLPAVKGYYSTTDGKMLSMPFASSTPVLWFNKDAFKKAGLDPNAPPKTWPEVGEAAKKLVAAGYSCGFSTAWITWIHLENFSAWHNVPFGTQENGFGGFNTEYTFNGPAQVKHIQQLADWQKDKVFVYGGRDNLGNAKFVSGECPMYTESSAGYASFKAGAKFEFGVSTLPYWPDVQGAPQNTIIGGASLWVMNGKKPETYKGVASFFNYLSKPDVQSASHKRTGYLPITMAAFELTEKSGFYKEKPGTDVAVTQMIRKTTDKSRGIRLGNFNQIRQIIDEETEQIWTGKKGPKEALDAAIARGNEQLEKFQKANKL